MQLVLISAEGSLLGYPKEQAQQFEKLVKEMGSVGAAAVGGRARSRVERSGRLSGRPVQGQG
eukprot:8987625-Lingulodinium_polyedra.AAC.1